MKNIMICPVCRQELTKEEHQYVCENNHRFDRAKSGYVNLLQSQKQSSKRHGDDKLMVRSRTDFLNAGYYSVLRDQVVAYAEKYSGKEVRLVDVGCGECYYTKAVYDKLISLGKEVSVLGVDISKDALIAAAKRNKEFDLAVASLYHLPIADDSCNCLVNMFAPHAEEEFARILSPDGVYIRVIPLEDHLFSLKKAIYDEPYRNTVADYELEGFRRIDTAEIRTSITIDNPTDLLNLFAMTPYYYKTGKKEQERFSNLTSLTTEIEFGVLVYQKL